MKSIAKLLPAACVAALLTMTAAQAHHSFAMFDREQEIVKTGTVARWAFNNPHSWLYINVKNEDGSNTLWSFEGSAPPSLLQRGVTGSTFEPGDTVVVNVKVVEGERTRIQAYEGVCIGRSGGGINESFTVRKISYGEGVERVFPLYSPMVDSIKLAGLKAHIVKGKDGRYNFSDLIEGEAAKKPAAEPKKTTESKGSPVVFDIGSVAIERSSIVYTDLQAGQEYALEDVKLKTGRIAQNAVMKSPGTCGILLPNPPPT